MHRIVGLLLACSVVFCTASEKISYSKKSYVVFEKNNGKTEKVHQIKLQAYDITYCQDEYYEKLCEDGSDHDGLYITYGAVIRSTVMTDNGQPSGSVDVYTVVDHDQGVGNRFRFSTASNPTVISSPPETQMTVTNVQDCQNDVSRDGLPCEQQWEATISVDNLSTLCDLDGEYSFQLDLECYAGINDCPPEIAGLQDVFTFTLDSQDMCGVEVGEVEVSGILTPYADSQMLDQQEAYKSGNTVFLKVDVQSDTATAVGQEINDITVLHRGQVTVLLVDRVPTAEGTSVNLVVNDVEGAFAFDLSPALFPIEFRQMENVEVSAFVSVEYLGGGGDPILLSVIHDPREYRPTLRGKSNTRAFSTVSVEGIKLDPSKFDNPLHASSATTLSFGLVVLFAVVCAVVYV